MKYLLSLILLLFASFSAFSQNYLWVVDEDAIARDPDAIASMREQRDIAFETLDPLETFGVGLAATSVVVIVVAMVFLGSTHKSRRFAVIALMSLVPVLSYAEALKYVPRHSQTPLRVPTVKAPVRYGQAITTWDGRSGVVRGRVASSRNVTTSAPVTPNPEMVSDIQQSGVEFATPYAYQAPQPKHSKKGAPLSPLDSQAPRTMPAVVPAGDAQTRYNNFLRSKGISPHTIGGAVVVNGRMIVPTIEEIYSVRNGLYADQLAGCRGQTAVIVLENRSGYNTPNMGYYWPNN